MELINLLGRTITLQQPIGTKMNFIATIRNQLCCPCNKNLCFIILKQALNDKVHNVGKQPLCSYFGTFIYAGIDRILRRHIR